MAIIFNPSFPYRLAHTVTGFYVTTGFVVIGVAAYYLRKGRFIEEARTMFSMTLWLLSLSVPAQILIGDLHGLNTREHQPAKLAAIEAHWETGSRVPLILFAIPDQEAEMNHLEISVPVLGSLILAHDPNGTIQGLKDFPKEDRAPVIVPFFAFRIMVGLGVIMLLIVMLSWWLRLKRDLYITEWYLRVCQYAAPIGFIAVLAGWTTTEVGRQPWTVYGLMRTAESVTPSLSGTDVALSLAGYMIVYLIMYPAGGLLMMKLVKRGPADQHNDAVEGGRPHSPVDALPLAAEGKEERAS
jgi:cytochrome bd ubiquinol oxidase subunit I